MAMSTPTRELGRTRQVIHALLFLHITCFCGSRYNKALNMSYACTCANSCHRDSRGRATNCESADTLCDPLSGGARHVVHVTTEWLRRVVFMTKGGAAGAHLPQKVSNLAESSNHITMSASEVEAMKDVCIPPIFRSMKSNIC